MDSSAGTFFVAQEHLKQLVSDMLGLQSGLCNAEIPSRNFLPVRQNPRNEIDATQGLNKALHPQQ